MVAQAALKALQQVGEKVDRSDLHAHQLMLWALENGNLDVDNRVRETIIAMSQCQPQDIMQLLERSAQGDRVGLPNLNKVQPLDLACSLIDNKNIGCSYAVVLLGCFCFFGRS
jgi:hypothetical protein